MRIISGKYKGKKLLGTSTNLLRPSSDYIKEVLFNIIQHHYKEYLLDKNFLDIYAGSGSIALEALSRGAKSITLIEKEISHYKLIKKNLSNIHHNIINKDFFLTNSNMFKLKYSMAYIDPPYNLNLLPNSLIHLFNLDILEDTAILITESKKKTFNKFIEINKHIIYKLNLQLDIVKTIGIKELHFFKFIK